MARWGMPSSQKAQLDAATKRADKVRAKAKSVNFEQLLRMEPDGGTTNIRNTASKHWKRWLSVERRCVVPFTSYSDGLPAECLVRARYLGKAIHLFANVPINVRFKIEPTQLDQAAFQNNR